MRDKRRHIFYVDKIFQKKLLILFLGINFVVALLNTAYYLTYLQGEVGKNLFRSHIVLSNMNEIIAKDVVLFNLILAAISLLLVIFFYVMARLKLKSFFQQVRGILTACQDRRKDIDFKTQIPEKFQEIDRVLGEFIQTADRQLADGDRQIDKLKGLLRQESEREIR
jgi:hypothetical protein